MNDRRGRLALTELIDRRCLALAALRTTLEGTGIKRLTASLERAPVNRDSRHRRASDRDGARAARTRGNLRRQLERMDVVGSVTIARGLPAGSTVVAIFCDGRARYLSRMFNDVWLRENNFTKGQTLTAIHGSR